MKFLVVTRAGGEVVCDRCLDARSPIARMKGLLGRRYLPPGEGILLRPASSIHTAFMRFPIDAVFLDGEGTVLKVEREMPAWRAAASRGSKAVLELSAGEAERRSVQVGDRLHWEGSGPRGDA
jgi:uncharacterized membrane protein (UPF0127 family)